MAEQLPAAGRGDGTPGLGLLARADCALRIDLSSSQPTSFHIFHSSDSLPIPLRGGWGVSKPLSGAGLPAEVKPQHLANYRPLLEAGPALPVASACC